MTELAERIYNQLLTSKQYNYSRNPSEKHLEIKAIEELENEKYIVIKIRTIGYVVADVL